MIQVIISMIPDPPYKDAIGEFNHHVNELLITIASMLRVDKMVEWVNERLK